MPLVIVQPWSSRVIGTRFLVRFMVTRAYSPSGCQATPCSRFASGTTSRSLTTDRANSTTVTSESGGVRGGVNRDRVLVTSIVSPSGETARDQGTREVTNRLVSSSVRRSRTEMLSWPLLST